jgi:iron complex transport system substrate-binding protein
MLGVQNAVVAIPTSVYRENSAAQYAALDFRIKSKSLPSPGNWDFVNIESIVALEPDLVIIWSQQTESIASLEQKGLSVYGVFLSSFQDVYKEIRDFGILTGTLPRAEKLIRYTKEEIAHFSISSLSTDIKRSNVYFMWAQGLLETSGTKSTVNELLELAGAINVCRSPQEHLVVNAETVLGWNPDVIVMWCNQGKSPADILDMAMWRNLSAIKNHRVYELPSVFYCDLWTLKFQYAVKMVAAWCYPDRFKTSDLERERRCMLDTLYGPPGSLLYSDK